MNYGKGQFGSLGLFLFKCFLPLGASVSSSLGVGTIVSSCRTIGENKICSLVTDSEKIALFF